MTCMPRFARSLLFTLLLAASGLAGGAGTVASLDDHRCETPPAGQRPAAVAEPGEAVRIAFVGDTLLADAAQPSLDRFGYSWPLARVFTLLDADEVVANLEGPLTERTEAYARRGPWSYNARPASAEALASVGITVAGLANNHAMDRGPEGLDDTIEALAATGVASVGAGSDAEAAIAPVILDTRQGQIAIVALGDHYGSRRIATGTRAGGATYAPCQIVRAADAARASGAHLLVGFVHWGANYSEVQPAQRALARLFVDAGYDLVVGHGPHVVQPVEVIDGVPVIYSLGNFVFGTPGRFSGRFPGYGLIATVEVSAGALRAVELRCIVTDNDRVAFQPHVCPADEELLVLDEALADTATLRRGQRLELPAPRSADGADHSGRTASSRIQGS